MKWINVNEEKVPQGTLVDVWVSNQDLEGRVCDCFYNPKNNKVWYWSDDGADKIQFYADDVTHWMPVPSAPSKDK